VLAETLNTAQSNPVDTLNDSTLFESFDIHLCVVNSLMMGVVSRWLQPSRKYTSKMVTKEMSKEIHAKVAPFIQWLKEAEEESSGDENEAEIDEEVEVHVLDSS